MKLAGGLTDLKSGLMLNFARISWLLWNMNLAKNPIVSNGRERIEGRQQMLVSWIVLSHRATLLS